MGEIMALSQHTAKVGVLISLHLLEMTFEEDQSSVNSGLC